MPSLRERIRKSSPKLHHDKQTRSHPSFNQEREKEEFLTLTSLFFWAYVVHSSSGRMPFASSALFYPLSIVCTHLPCTLRIAFASRALYFRLSIVFKCIITLHNSNLRSIVCASLTSSPSSSSGGSSSSSGKQPALHLWHRRHPPCRLIEMKPEQLVRADSEASSSLSRASSLTSSFSSSGSSSSCCGKKNVGLAVTHNLGAELTNEKPTCIFDNAAAKHQKQKHTAARMTMQYKCDVLCVTLLWTRENFHLFIFVRI